ncbi:leucine-rich repeat domain-containing protein [Myxococcus llanfairpwllgwyngyllgogerychwyrndrobwllllantysiliogogogochensis]|uniref:Leucine-rich repeat domain-containing protein n=1 Tax=Myxococcus llanfairpwllgwyngyllgogerychwyrndrobwllllantysiliogogogochensis TaxID=2590453 RepID=A0A540X8D2_9BACT|nr:leucine-rich repeat domain-containing protein [Myxococcus llanfairpwllgwyngyllgogerychwyrndrobwllllantysiliogogogochensis]TQF17497.1 leucine-rich repeat domain-containing protein [Myxococcus llanfairpwllgwyngyllgogerychwyrndrobwllllantysiliogogogochensis]
MFEGTLARMNAPGSEQEIKQLLKSSEPAQVRQALDLLPEFPTLSPLLELFDSIWRMTYANAEEPDVTRVARSGLEYRIALMNEQEDLVPSPLAAIEAVEQLDLGGFPKASLSPELARYTHLRRLDLWENGLEELPDEVFSLRSLEVLYVSDPLRRLSPKIGNLTNLRQLRLAGGALEALPETLTQLKRLELLELDSNCLGRSPDFLLELPSLREVRLSWDESEPFNERILKEWDKRGVRYLF